MTFGLFLFFTEIIIDLDNGLVPNKQQSII